MTTNHACTTGLYTARDLLTRHSSGPSLEKVAIVDGDRRITYRELLERSFSYAGLLKQSGVRRGDRVCIFLRRSVEAVAALFATWLTGGVAVIINEQLQRRQVQHILQHSEAVCLVSDGARLRQAAGTATDGLTVIDLDQMHSPAGLTSTEPVIGADLALIMYTSGSTGLPKGVMVSHENLLSGTRIVSDYLELSEADVILSILPFSFDYGLNQLLTALYAGGTLVIQRSVFPPEICNTLEKVGITGLAGVPMLWVQLTGRLSPFLKRQFPKLRYITNSGGRLPEEIVKAIRATHPHVEIYLMYGLTEAFRSTYLPPAEVDRRPSSMGKAIPNVEVMVVSPTGATCKPGEIGELVHRGAHVSLGYWRDPESTGRVFRPHPSQHFFNGREELVVFSGDLVKTDEEGYLYFVGRKDQQIKSRGFRISPEEVEKLIVASKLVSSAVAFAVPIEGDYDIGVAVIPREPSNFRQEQLDEFCKNEMPEYMRPRAIWAVDQFPLTTTGKADRTKIRDTFCATS